MGYATLLLMATLMDAPAVSVSTLQGGQFAGHLQFLTDSELVLKQDNSEKRIALDQVLEFHRTENKAVSEDAEAIEVQLIDDSLIGCSQVTTTQKTVTIQSKQLGKVTLDISQIKAIRFAEANAEGIRDSWRELRSRELKRDLLVIRKENALDYLDGAVGTIDEAQVRFLLDKDLIPVQREKVFGVVYQRDTSASAQPACRLEFLGGAVLFAKSIAWAGDKYRVTLTSGTEVEVPPTELTAADFSFGKLRYLSQMEPRDVEYTPFFDITWSTAKTAISTANQFALAM